ncbi:hypothetical protein QR680_004263 [Steinernema hermaphroditum]|uniref:Major facilitator superfamily (MFS) profile domain-containing protein n=1 Tax=Steinernema hermaphroditum TaxID=289476 RepID=A0AA39HN66_9BILA|nr:hypothetical protein QR680_004263 [Steinernema hermaphroditum]
MIPHQSLPDPEIHVQDDNAEWREVNTSVISSTSSSKGSDSLLDKAKTANSSPTPDKTPTSTDSKEDMLSNKEKNEGSPGFMSLNRLQWATLIMLAVTTLADAMEMACISPFFPTEAEKKGLSSSEVGFIMGAYQLATLIFSPIMGRYMATVGPKPMFIGGLLVVGVMTICLGFMRHWPEGRPFFIIALVVYSIKAIGDTADITASLAILAERFPGMLATMIGLFECIAGVGYMIGPVLGGALLQYGGLELPFILMGSIIIAGALVSIRLVSDLKDAANGGENKGMTAMLKIPMMWVMVYAMVISRILLSFLDPTLSPHLESLNLTPTAIGGMFVLSSGTFALTAPLWGIMIDKFRCTDYFIFGGAIASIPAVLLIGPSPLLGLAKSVLPIGIGLGILGVATGAFAIPVFQRCCDTVNKYGFEDNAQTYGGISGIYSAATALGGFLGPTMGGVVVEWVGFPWTVTVLGVGLTVFVITLFLSYLAVGTHKRRERRKQTKPESV